MLLVARFGYFAYARIYAAYIKRLDETKVNGMPADMDQPRRKVDRAAAVCYRRSPRGLEFLLVKTTGGHRWTFPKGRIAKGEEFHRAAEREAAEEAGVTGAIETDLLTHYEYPRDRRPLLVAAYLLEVQSLGSPEEAFRSPTWCLPDEAKSRLAQEREEHYVAESHRLVDAAVNALGDGERG